MNAPPPRLAAALSQSEARQCLDALLVRYQDVLTAAQLTRLWHRRHHATTAATLNLLLGQLATHDITIDSDLRRYAEAVCIEWADARSLRRAS